MGIPFRFLQCGDLHLGAPFRYLKSLGRSWDEMMCRATYRSFQNVVDLALRERVAAVLITGDIYNGEDHNLEGQMQFVKGCERLQEGRIPVYVVQGNHDVAESWSRHITLPNQVHICSSERIDRFPLMVNGKEVAAIYGQSLTSHTTGTNLAAQIRPLQSDTFSIAMVHGTVGTQEHHDATGPCTMDDLRGSPISYWAFGHIHKRQVISTAPHVVYAGNTQGLHALETGPKGCYIVDVSSHGAVDLHFYETNAIRFEEATIDISQVQSVMEMMEMLRHKKEMLRHHKPSIMLRIRLVGTGPLLMLCQDKAVREAWLRDTQEEESGTHQVMIYAIVDDTTQGPTSKVGYVGMVEDFQAAMTGVGVSTEALRQRVMGRPEWKRLGIYQELITDDMLERAFTRAQAEGVRVLQGDGYED